MPWRDVNQSLRNIKVEVELGFDAATAWKEAQRCLNCDVQTVFTDRRSASNATPASTSARPTASPSPPMATKPNCAPGCGAPAANTDRRCMSSNGLKTGRVMVKDEDVCLHCGLCAERCPTGAWDMQKFLFERDPRRAGLPHAAARGRLMRYPQT